MDSDETGYLHHDLNKARALMAEYGKPIELNYLHTATSRGRAAGMIVQQMEKEAYAKGAADALVRAGFTAWQNYMRDISIA